MEITENQKHQINAVLIGTNVHVNNVLTLLLGLDYSELEFVVNNTPEHLKDTGNYKLQIEVLNFYKKVLEILEPKENNIIETKF